MTSFENGLHNDEDEDVEDDDDDESCARLSAQTNYANCICSLVQSPGEEVLALCVPNVAR